ncbi:hypothetical protein DEU35_2582 [Microbacterium sp. AG157]|uniref:hypothetical protein n=1 Tax=Microbacterium TaxID=33882 RepID=UPI000E3AC788|nr:MULTISPECIES: hypothetical protein [Microbacterium]REC98083.1 hypothetical protein DEU35_2582 [Microbacterium sp. AG157]WJS90902.1 hypothetical protein NYQ11_16550 [Microbacterium testaceum]
MKRFAPVVILATGIALIAVLFGVGEAIRAEWLRYAAFAVIPAAGLAIVAVRKKRETATRSFAEEGIEADVDRKARASAFRDVLVAAPILLLAAVLLADIAGWVWLAGLLFIALGDYWIRIAATRPRRA